MAGLALIEGELEFATALCTGFHCLLRPTELQSFDLGSVIFDDMAGTAIISLNETKTSRRHGVPEF
eukprot:10879642-Karenia_brevis.AAC.1